MQYKEGYKYQLHADLSVFVFIKPKLQISSDYIDFFPDGTLKIFKGYAWDGPSGLSIDTKSFMRASLVHDALYQLMREGSLDFKYRYQADVELKRLCEADGMFAFRAWYVFKTVRIFGKKYSLPENKKKLITLPYNR